jgi:hypothetical protein
MEDGIVQDGFFGIVQHRYLPRDLQDTNPFKFLLLSTIVFTRPIMLQIKHLREFRF